MTMPTQAAKVLHLPPVAPERMRLFNAVSLRGLVRTGKIGDMTFGVRWLPTVPVFKAELLVRFSINGQAWTAAFDSTSLAALHPLFAEPETKGVSPSSLPAPLLGAVLDDLLNPLLTSLSGALGLPIVLEEVLSTENTEATPLLGALLMWKSHEGTPQQMFMRLATSPASALALADGLRAVPRTTSGFLTGVIEGIPYQLGVMAGETVMPYADYRTLVPGDVVVPDVWTVATGEVTLALRSPQTTLHLGRATLNEKTITLGEAMTPAQERTMQNTDDLEVKLTFELDSRTITVSELKSLEPGYSFRLTKDPGSIVTVLANGRPVARGCLVDIGGAVGVQLTERVAPGANDEH